MAGLFNKGGVGGEKAAGGQNAPAGGLLAGLMGGKKLPLPVKKAEPVSNPLGALFGGAAKSAPKVDEPKIPAEKVALPFKGLAGLKKDKSPSSSPSKKEIKLPLNLGQPKPSPVP